MKYRIIKKSNSYFPQWKWVFWWFHFRTGYTDNIVECKTLKEAEDWILDILERRKESNISQVVKEYNTQEPARNTGLQ